MLETRFYLPWGCYIHRMIYIYIWAYVLFCCIESLEPALKKKVVYRHVSIPSTVPWVLPEIEVALHFHVSSQQVWVVISHIISNTFPKLEFFRSSLEIIWERCWILYHDSRYGHYALHIIPHYLLENIILNDVPIVPHWYGHVILFKAEVWKPPGPDCSSFWTGGHDRAVCVFKVKQTWYPLVI
jgi:hypothetical protein